MEKFLVCKTIVPYGQGKVQYVLFFLKSGWRLFDSLEELAGFMGGGTLDSEVENYVKNEAPIDIIRQSPSGLVYELERLTRDEVRQLAKLLRK